MEKGCAGNRVNTYTYLYRRHNAKEYNNTIH
jgi:hypothetical protein